MMKPIASKAIPKGKEWLYEVKYDGFRCTLQWDQASIQLISKNNKDLTNKFPEIIADCRSQQEGLIKYLPLQLDGELVIMNNNIQANFGWVQKRGRMKTKEVIEEAARNRPASLQLFDITKIQGKPLEQQTLTQRKRFLTQLFKEVKFSRLHNVPCEENSHFLWDRVFMNKGEGIIAKRKSSAYKLGKNHQDWFKIKNWRKLHGFLTAFHTANSYFTVGVFDGNNVLEIGKCKHGLESKTFQTLTDIFRSKGEKQGDKYILPPAICAEIHSLDLYEQELREPEFVAILPDMNAQDVTLEQLRIDMAMLPEKIDLTNTTKTFWPEPDYTKGDLLTYIREITPYLLPHVRNRALTVIRAPDGVEAEHFFQKHLPNYAPAFIPRQMNKESSLILCNTLDSLIWFANHGAVEFHVPFQTINREMPQEIVFDLDPPHRDSFPLAVKAAQIMKPLLDDLDLISFVKTSGNKGLQIYIPIPPNSMTYEQTALFTQSIAWTMENAYPDLFTTERMKNKRKNRLYIDYVQHGKNKTIIAPYSPRLAPEGTVATPLFWEEINAELTPSLFTISNVVDRVKSLGCPFSSYEDAKKKQNLEKILQLLTR
ncbi:hypothetical protein M948_06655 [Virgibacillus sp. CM-4]|uniref:DNA ligase D n=1 Tax=Virgibacillus sp. CM-4 TaxID=1354277 RepID=UPI00038843A4|nr:hypothetical protein M948_06655 [Virgibacillus sp. CM-4]